MILSDFWHFEWEQWYQLKTMGISRGMWIYFQDESKCLAQPWDVPSIVWQWWDSIGLTCFDLKICGSDNLIINIHAITYIYHRACPFWKECQHITASCLWQWCLDQYNQHCCGSVSFTHPTPTYPRMTYHQLIQKDPISDNWQVWNRATIDYGYLWPSTSLNQ